VERKRKKPSREAQRQNGTVFSGAAQRDGGKKKDGRSGFRITKRRAQKKTGPSSNREKRENRRYEKKDPWIDLEKEGLIPTHDTENPGGTRKEKKHGTVYAGEVQKSPLGKKFGGKRRGEEKETKTTVTREEPERGRHASGG